MKQAYAEVGNGFKVENVRWISDDQFAYATGVTVSCSAKARRQHSGRCVLGRVSRLRGVGGRGAIQISGTATPDPFFVAACDYCLIGEEARGSATSAGSPCFGSLVVQDWGKMVGVILIVAGTLITSFGSDSLAALLAK